MNARSIEILNIFINSNCEQTVEELSKKFGVSKRMIRYDIDDINIYLRENNIKEIDKKPNSPLSFDLSTRDKEKLKNIIDNISSNQYIFSTEERVGILLYEILSSSKECNYKNLQEKLFISKTTLFSDVKKVKLWLEKFDIDIIKVSNKGFKVDGEEENIRKAIVELLIENNKYNIIETLEKIYKNENKNIIDSIKRIDINMENLNYIKSLIKEVEEEFGVFSEEAFMNIVMSIFVIISRSSKKEFLNPKDKEKNQYKFRDNYKKEYKSASKIAKSIREKYSIDVSNEEIDTITSTILSGSKNEKNIFDSIDYFEACNIAGKLIDNIKIISGKDFKIDNNLFEGFINHLKSLIFRLKYKIISKNPILETIISNYKEEFSLVKEASRFIEDKFNCILTDDEVGYLVMYIGANIEKNKRKEIERTKNILIVCSAGFATGRLIEAKMKNYFKVNIIGVTSIHGMLGYINTEKIDYIIASVDLENSFNIKTIKVNPMLTEEDFNVLKKVFTLKEDIKNISSIKDILDIVDRNCNIINMDNLIEDLNNYIIGKENKTSYIKKYLTEDNIQINLKAKDWKEAIRLSAYPLLKKDIIKKEYIEAMISNVESLGPYIVVDDLIAIPHAKPNKYVKGFGITITTFEEPIIMGDHKDVRIFITLASGNNKEHIEIIREIMNLIEDENFTNNILQGKFPF